MTVNAPIDIVNNALILLGIRPGTTRSENTRSMQFMNTKYESTRDFVLASGNWNSAQKRVALTRLASTPAWGYDYEFQLPSDYMRLVRMDDQDIQFRIEGRKLLTNDTEANVIYVFRLTEVQAMDELLKSAIGARLAYDTALANKADMQQVAFFRNVYEDYVSLANLVDASQAPVDQVTGTEWLRARLGFAADIYRPLEPV